MSKKQPNNITNVIIEITIAVLPVVAEIVRRFLDRDDRAGKTTRGKANAKPKAA